MSRCPQVARFAPTLVPVLLGAALATSLACAKVMPMSGTPGSGGATGGTTGGPGAAGTTGAAGATGAAGTAAPTGTGGTIVIATDGGSGDAACTPSVTCTPPG